MDTYGYCVRVDALDGYGDKLPLLTACHDYKSIIAVKHNGTSKENPHYHIVVRTDVQQQAFRVRMRKIFDQGKGNGHMSIKQWDGNNDAISYLFHEDENTHILVQHNISDETVAQAKARNRQVVEMVQASKAKASWHLEEVVYEQLKTDDRKLDDQYVGKHIILAALRHGKYVPQPWHVRAMTERIQFKRLNGVEEDEDRFAWRLAGQIFYKQ